MARTLTKKSINMKDMLKVLAIWDSTGQAQVCKDCGYNTLSQLRSSTNAEVDLQSLTEQAPGAQGKLQPQHLEGEVVAERKEQKGMGCPCCTQTPKCSPMLHIRSERALVPAASDTHPSRQQGQRGVHGHHTTLNHLWVAHSSGISFHHPTMVCAHEIRV